MAAMEA
jgi:hypothetical protein